MNNKSKTIQVLMTVGISSAAMLLAVGCETNSPKDKTASGVRSDVTDVHPMDAAAPAAYQPPLYDTSAVIPTAPQAVTVEQPVVTPMMSTNPVVGSTTTGKGQTHIVRRGETFFSIAKASYGDGKQWKKIASANPTVSMSHLKVGQAIVVP